MAVEVAGKAADRAGPDEIRLSPDGRPAAAIRQRLIYVRAAEGSETTFRFQQEGDASTFAWIDQGFGFAVTAMANQDELPPIAETVYRGFVGVGDVGEQRKGR